MRKHGKLIQAKVLAARDWSDGLLQGFSEKQNTSRIWGADLGRRFSSPAFGCPTYTAFRRRTKMSRIILGKPRHGSYGILVKKSGVWLRVGTRLRSQSVKFRAALVLAVFAIVFNWYGLKRAWAQECDVEVADLDVESALVPKDAASYSARGSVRARVGDLIGAREDFDRAIELDPKSADAHCGRGYLRLYNADYKEALADFDRATVLEPKNVAAYCGRGQARSDLGNEKDALADFNYGIKLDPANAPSYIFRGYHLGLHGEKTRAISDFDQTIKLDPNNALAYCYRGSAREAVKDNDGAVSDYTKVIKFDPQYAWAYYRRGQARDQIGDRAGAIADFSQYIRLKPDDPWGFRARGFTKHERGQMKGAIQDYSKAIALDATDAWTFSARGFERGKIGNTKGSVADYKAAARIEKRKMPLRKPAESQSKGETVSLITDPCVYSFSAKTISNARNSFGPPRTPIKQILLFHRPGPHCQTVMWDEDKGMFCIFMANKQFDAYFYGNLGHELVHLLNAKLCDPYVEGLCSVFGEEALGEDQMKRAAYRGLLMATPFYKETYLMMKEIEGSLDSNRYNSIFSFASYDQAKQWMHIEIDKWLSSLAEGERNRVAEIIGKYADAIEKTMPKDGLYLFARPKSPKGSSAFHARSAALDRKIDEVVLISLLSSDSDLSSADARSRWQRG